MAHYVYGTAVRANDYLSWEVTYIDGRNNLVLGKGLAGKLTSPLLTK
ncbi:MAG: hypothetical protein WAM44_14575 [Chthoniobacterales bacterium]